MSATDIKEVVKEKYGQAALRINAGGSSCCGAASALDGCCDPITSNLYDAAQTGALPEEAVLASLGCGNPTALARLNPGETVLDLDALKHRFCRTARGNFRDLGSRKVSVNNPPSVLRPVFSNDLRVTREGRSTHVDLLVIGRNTD